MSVGEPIPIFPGMFDLEESYVDERVPVNCVSGVSDSAFSTAEHLSRECELNDFTHLPFSCLEGQEPKKCEDEASVDDFMKLIATLIENLDA